MPENQNLPNSQGNQVPQPDAQAQSNPFVQANSWETLESTPNEVQQPLPVQPQEAQVQSVQPSQSNQEQQSEMHVNAWEPEKTDAGSTVITQIQGGDEGASPSESVFSRMTDTSRATKSQVQKKVEKKGVPVLGILAGLAIMFLLFIGMMVAVVAFGDTSNSGLGSLFGMDLERLKQVLLIIVNASFGVVAFLMLLVFVISVFRVSVLKKEEKNKRKRVIRNVIFSLLFLVFVLVGWFGTYSMVSGIKLPVALPPLEIETEPKDLSGLVAPVDITFDAKAIVDGLIARKKALTLIEWDFDGDGIAEHASDSPSDTSVKYRFEREGSTRVDLIASFEDEEKQVFTKEINIAQAEFLANPSEGTAPLTVKFNAASLEREDNPADSFSWDFDGDGAFEEETHKPTTQHTFEKIGTYEVGLRIMGINKIYRTYSKKIEVRRDDAEKLRAEIHIEPGSRGEAPFKVSLDAENSMVLEGEIKLYEWDFGDGSGIKRGRTVSHTYRDAGVYMVNLLIETDEGEKDAAELEVEVEGSAFAPEAKLLSDLHETEEQGKIEGVIPFEVNFDASQSRDADDNIVEYAWDLDGDGEFDEYGQRLDYVFEKEGEYEVRLRVTDADEQSSEAVVAVFARARDLEAILDAVPLSGAVPLKVEFDASTSVYKKGKIVTYQWDFGDGGRPEYGDAQRTHIYNEEGRYEVKVKVITDDGAEAETKKSIFVRALKLQACFASSEEKGEAPLTVEFDATCTQGEVTDWKWDFGDGFISTSYAPTHTFREKGSYTVTLELVDEKNNLSNFKSVIVVE